MTNDAPRCARCRSTNVQRVEMAWAQQTSAINVSIAGVMLAPPAKPTRALPTFGLILAFIGAVGAVALLATGLVGAALAWGLTVPVGGLVWWLGERVYAGDLATWTQRIEKYRRQWVCLACGAMYEPVVVTRLSPHPQRRPTTRGDEEPGKVWDIS